MHIVAAKAVAFGEALQPEFAAYQKQVLANAKMLADTLQSKGIPVITGGTDNHIVLMNVGALGLTGKQCEGALEKAGMTVNKNMIPYDPNPPQVSSGIRIGPPALTTRGMGIAEMKQIALWISEVFEHPDDPQVLLRIREDVRTMSQSFPLYPEYVQSTQ